MSVYEENIHLPSPVSRSRLHKASMCLSSNLPPHLFFFITPRAVVLEVWSSNKQHQHHWEPGENADPHAPAQTN